MTIAEILCTEYWQFTHIRKNHLYQFCRFTNLRRRFGPITQNVMTAIQDLYCNTSVIVFFIFFFIWFFFFFYFSLFFLFAFVFVSLFVRVFVCLSICCGVFFGWRFWWISILPFCFSDTWFPELFRFDIYFFLFLYFVCPEYPVLLCFWYLILNLQYTYKTCWFHHIPDLSQVSYFLQVSQLLWWNSIPITSIRIIAPTEKKVD